MQRSFILIKPDGTERNLIGEIIKRFEEAGLRVIALELFVPTREQIDHHYPKTDAWITRLGQKSKSSYADFDEYSFEEDFPNMDEIQVGQMIRTWLVDYLSGGRMVRMVVEGTSAIDIGRSIVGETMPYRAAAGTIRGDFSDDAPARANHEKRVIYNLVHASETPEEAEHEIAHWFGPDFT